MEAIDRKVCGEDLTFFAQKAIHWCRRRTLMVADLHWGKAETFQKAGIPISSMMLQEDLQRLRTLIQQTGAERLILLGDLLHGKQGLTADVIETVSAWRAALPLEILLIRGNHERNIRIPPAWDLMEYAETYDEGPFRFSHHPRNDAPLFTFCGHLHPVVHVGSRRDRMRLPCYWLQENCGILPSFGSFTGGAAIKPARRDQVLVIAENQVFDLKSSGS